MYPAYMEESIRKVEATRQKRLQETIPYLNDEEKTPLLQKYHPDFIEESMRELLVGPNKGDRTPNEIADLLEGSSRINPDKINLDKIDYDVDVLIIGCGGAGASAALLAQENGAKVLIITKLRLGDANTVGAQAGTQAADRPNDSPAIHYLDTMGGGRFTNIPELVEALVKDAPSAIKWLESLGVNWDKEPDGSMHELSGGGTSRRRLHSARDYTGLEEMRVLRDEIKNRQIEYLEFLPAIELILIDDHSTDDTYDWLIGFDQMRGDCFKRILVSKMTDKTGIYHAFKQGIELANERYVMTHGIDDPVSMDYVSAKIKERSKHPDDTHIASEHIVQNESGDKIDEWKINIHDDIRKYLYEELSMIGGRLPFANSLLPRESVLKAYNEMDRRLLSVGVTNLEVCFDVMLMDQLILMGLIKHVVRSPLKATYVHGDGNNSNQMHKRIENLPIFLANIYSQVWHELSFNEEFKIRQGIELNADKIYGKANGAVFMDNFMKYARLFDEVE